MSSIGMAELVIVLAVVLLIFGAAKLPAIGKALGRSIKEFKKASKEGGEEVSPEADKKDTGPK